jgi:hypothetical protein
LIRPEPTEGGAETVAAPVTGVAAIGHFELVFISSELEGSGEVFVREGPVAEEVV